MKLSKLLFIPLIGLFMGGCDMIDYHPYDVRISGPTDINNRNIAKIEANCKDKTTIRFVTMGDSQRWYDETQDFVNHLNKRIAPFSVIPISHLLPAASNSFV